MAESIATGFNQALNFTPPVSVDSIVVIAADTPVLERPLCKSRPSFVIDGLTVALQHEKP
jgi:hypothetical protein